MKEEGDGRFHRWIYLRSVMLWNTDNVEDSAGATAWKIGGKDSYHWGVFDVDSFSLVELGETPTLNEAIRKASKRLNKHRKNRGLLVIPELGRALK